MRAIAFVTCLLMVPATAQAESWRLGGGGGQRPNRFMSFIDADTIRRSGETVTFRERQVLESPDRTGTVDQLATYRANCRTGEHRALEVAYVKTDGRVNRYGEDAESAVAAPGSVIASVIDAACGTRELRDEIDDPEAASRAFWRERD